MSSLTVQVRDRLRFAVEDRFLILRLWEESQLLPTGTMATMLAPVLGSLSSNYSLICDLTSMREMDDIEAVTGDVVEFLCELKNFSPVILARRNSAKLLMEELRHSEANWATEKILFLRQRPPDFDFHDFPIPPDLVGSPISLGGGSVFSEDLRPGWKSAIEDIDTISPPSKEEFRLLTDLYRKLHEVVEEDDPDWPSLVYENAASEWHASLLRQDGYDTVLFATRWLAKAVPLVGRNSLLAQFAIELAGDRVVTTPYHGHSAYTMETPSGLLVGRPSVLARKTYSLFSTEVERFSALLSASPKEAEIQRFLEQTPSMLRSLGYLAIYPQVVLARDDGTYLRPDFILQPIGEEWCDIKDIKLPMKHTIVGGRDRKTLSACIHELAAQLREYAAYFENPIYSKRVEEKYGIKCYKPRLIGLVGRDAYTPDERQLRRLMTCYEDVEVLTFDRLLNLAKSRILI